MQGPTGKLYASHGAGQNSAWFIVKPNLLGLDDEIESLINAGRTVIALDIDPHQGKKIEISVKPTALSIKQDQ